MEEFKCLKCVNFLNDVWNKCIDLETDNIPSTCQLQCEYYCSITDYSLFKNNIE